MPRRRPEPVDTRTRLLEAAHACLASEGAEALSLREVARRVGISAPSVYEHFEGREALLDALATAAHARLRDALKRAADSTDDDPLVALGLAYVAFARREPEAFRLLFLLRTSARPGLSTAPSGGSAYGVLLAAVQDDTTRLGRATDSPTDHEHRAYALWSLAHGIACLRIGHLRSFDADFDAADRAALVALVRGGRAVEPEHAPRRARTRR